MDEISHSPKWDFRLPPRRWLAVAVGGGLIAAVAMLIAITGGSRQPSARQVSPSVPAALRPLAATVLARIPLPVSQSSDMALLGSTAWITDWYTGKVVGVDLSARRITTTLHIGSPQDGPIGVAAGAGSVWVLDFSSGSLLRIDPSTGMTTGRLPIRGEALRVAYGHGFVWVIAEGSGQGHGAGEVLYKVDPARDLVDRVARIPGSGPGCVASPGPQGIWVGCAGVAGVVLIDPASLKPVKRLPIGADEYSPQIVSGQRVVWVLTSAGLVRADPATATVTGTLQTSYDPSAESVPALTMDPQGRVWVAGSMLDVLFPGSRTVREVAHTEGAVSVVTDGRSVWVDTGTTLVELDVRGESR